MSFGTVESKKYFITVGLNTSDITQKNLFKQLSTPYNFSHKTLLSKSFLDSCS